MTIEQGSPYHLQISKAYADPQSNFRTDDCLRQFYRQRAKVLENAVVHNIGQGESRRTKYKCA
jgi:hypothetical protein